MKACVLHGVADLRYEEVPTPSPRPGEVLVEVKACGVCGSDIPRVFSKGTYRFPIIPGHEFAGIVAAAGPDGTGAGLVGRPVTVFPLIPCRNCPACDAGAFAQCAGYDYLGSRSDGAFAEYVRVPQWNLVPLPDGVTFEEAAMTEPCAVALHAVRRASVEPGDTVLIMGAGPIGLMVAMWARIDGAGRVLLADIDDAKLEFAQRLGFDRTFNPARSGTVPAAGAAWVQDTTALGANVAIDAAGTAAAVEACLTAARIFGRVVLLGNPPGDMTLSQDAYWAILRKELQIRGTWNSTRTELRGNEWQTSLDFIAAKRLPLKDLITHRVPLEKLPDALQMMRNKKTFFNKVIFTKAKNGH
ncbi:MAG: galactitol-1-phosphate 5-dehydrogenase [Candidatus Hydrogenedentes bacterium]|nr:galactitol-1-phosphate 5-dehydrogenase [Candidatus Hydrogenedentota bacterium]